MQSGNLDGIVLTEDHANLWILQLIALTIEIIYNYQLKLRQVRDLQQLYFSIVQSVNCMPIQFSMLPLLFFVRLTGRQGSRSKLALLVHLECVKTIMFSC